MWPCVRTRFPACVSVVQVERVHPLRQELATLRFLFGQHERPAATVEDHADAAAANFFFDGLAGAGAAVKAPGWLDRDPRLFSGVGGNLPRFSPLRLARLV